MHDYFLTDRVDQYFDPLYSASTVKIIISEIALFIFAGAAQSAVSDSMLTLCVSVSISVCDNFEACDWLI